MEFLTFLRYAHDGWRWLVLLALLIVVGKMVLGLVQKSRWSSADRTLGLVTNIVVGIQWILGLILWAPQMARWTADPGAVGAFEHPVLMTIAVAVISIFWGRARRAEPDQAKYRQATIGFVAGGLIILFGIWRVTSGQFV